MNCPTNTYSCCNSCCSSSCSCKKITTTTTTTNPPIPCDVTNCEQVIDLQCIIHYEQSECLSIKNNDLQGLIGIIFEKVTGYNCSCNFSDIIVQNVQNFTTTSTTTIN